MSKETNSQYRGVPNGVRRSKKGFFESAMVGEKREILVHLNEDLISKLDEKSTAHGESRSVTIARLLLRELNQQPDQLKSDIPTASTKPKFLK